MKFYCCVLLLLFVSIYAINAQSQELIALNNFKSKNIFRKHSNKLFEIISSDTQSIPVLDENPLPPKAVEKLSLNDFIESNIAEGSTNYCLEFENKQDQSIIKFYRGSSNPSVNLDHINGLEHGNAYKIKFINFKDGVWINNNQSIELFFSPDLQPISLDDSFCGSTGIELDQSLYSNYPGQLSEIHWVIENNDLNYFSERFTTSYSNSIKLREFEGLKAGFAYTVKLSGRINDKWSAFGDDCTITLANNTPVVIYGNTENSEFNFFLNQNIECNIVTEAIAYQWIFEESATGNDYIFISSSPKVYLGEVDGLVSNSIYSVKVRSKIKDNWQQYGPEALIYILDSE